MKNIFTVILLLVVGSITAQKDHYMSFEAGFDPSHIGKDYIFEFAMVAQNFEVNVGYEVFPELDFSKYTVGIGYHFPLYAYAFGKELKTTFIPTIEPTMISRTDTWGGGLGHDIDGKEIHQDSGHLSLALNLSLNWKLTDDLGIEYTFNMLPRTDLYAMYPHVNRNDMSINGVPIVCSNYIKFVYRIDR